MPLIECKDLTLSYDNKIVLSDLSFSVNAGDYLCIIGDNGSGKSTLVKSLLSLKPTHMGEIIFGDGLKRKEIGYLPQQMELKNDFPASVWEIVLSGCLASRGFRPFYNASDRKKAQSNMEKLGIADLKNRSFFELSGGQRQRVLLARALCATKKLILLDEPVSGLDPAVTGELYALIKKINDEGTTVIMVSHDIKGALKYASHILHLKKKPVFFGKTEDYIADKLGKNFDGGEADV